METEFELDSSKARTLQLSNDAFFYLAYGEEPLDEGNLDEAIEIQQMFPRGYNINDWEYVDGEFDLIQATFVPYVESKFEYDGTMDYITKDYAFQYKMLDNSTAYVCIKNIMTNQIQVDFVCNVVQFNSRPWVVFKDNKDASALADYSGCCMIPLFKCNKR